MKKLLLIPLLLLIGNAHAQVCTGPTSPACPKGDYKMTTQYSCDDGTEVNQVATFTLDNDTGTWTSNNVGTYHNRAGDPGVDPMANALTTFTADCNGTWTKPVRNGLFETTDCTVTDQARYSNGAESPRLNVLPYNVTQFDFQTIFNDLDSQGGLVYFDPDTPQILDFGGGMTQTRYCNGTGQFTKHKANNTFPVPTVAQVDPADPGPEIHQISVSGANSVVRLTLTLFDRGVEDGRQIVKADESVSFSWNTMFAHTGPCIELSSNPIMNGGTFPGQGGPSFGNSGTELWPNTPGDFNVTIQCNNTSTGGGVRSIETIPVRIISDNPPVDPNDPIVLGRAEYKRVVNGESCETCHGTNGLGLNDPGPVVGLYDDIADFINGLDLQTSAFYIGLVMPAPEAGTGGMPTDCVDVNDGNPQTDCATNVSAYIQAGFPQ